MAGGSEKEKAASFLGLIFSVCVEKEVESTGEHHCADVLWCET